jgi:hypothetical protein
MSSQSTDTFGIVNFDTWQTLDIGLLSYIKTPLQQTYVTNNSDLIARTLRQSILYFAQTLSSIDRSSVILGNEFCSTRTHKYQVSRSKTDKTSDLVTVELTTYAPIAFESIRSVVGITRDNFHSSFDQGDLLSFANTGRSGSQMFKTQDDVGTILTQSIVLANFIRILYVDVYCQDIACTRS